MDTDKAKEDKVLEDDFQKRMTAGQFDMSGVIVFSHSSDQYEFVPAAGFPNCPSVEEMCKLDLKKPSLTVIDRDFDWDLKSPLDEFGLPAKLFCRIEDGE